MREKSIAKISDEELKKTGMSRNEAVQVAFDRSRMTVSAAADILALKPKSAEMEFVRFVIPCAGIQHAKTKRISKYFFMVTKPRNQN